MLWCTVKSADKERAYKELPIIKNWFSFPILTMEVVHYTFIRNSGYKEQMVRMIFLYKHILLYWFIM